MNLCMCDLYSLTELLLKNWKPAEPSPKEHPAEVLALLRRRKGVCVSKIGVALLLPIKDIKATLLGLRARGLAKPVGRNSRRSPMHAAWVSTATAP